MAKNCFETEVYTQYKYFILPEEIENITRIIKIDDPSLFRIGIQAPHLSINLGVTNQPFLTSFVTTVGELATYRSIISAFSDEINKLNKPTLKFSFDHVNKRLHMLTDIDTNLILEVYIRIEQEELFDFHLFKDYVIGLTRIRQADAVGRFNFQLPGNFSYNANDMKSEGEKLVEKVETKIKEESQVSFFFMSR